MKSLQSKASRAKLGELLNSLYASEMMRDSLLKEGGKAIRAEYYATKARCISIILHEDYCIPQANYDTATLLVTQEEVQDVRRQEGI